MTVRRALTIVRDQDLLEDLDRAAAVAGCELDRYHDVPGGRQAWPSAPVVLLDSAAVAQCAAAGLARRHNVFVLCRGEPPAELWRRCVEIGADALLPMPGAESALVGALADAAEERCDRGRVIAVIGGRGGAGASVFAAAVALVAVRRGRRALLVDCDPLGGGMDFLLGAEDVAGLRWPQLGLPGGRVSASSLHAALPAVPADGGRLTVLSCGRTGVAPTAEAVAAVVDSGRRAGDTVVCDLPRHLPDTAVVALDRAELVLLVVPADARACAAALPVADRLRAMGAPAHLVVRGPAPGGLAAADVSRAVELPLLVAMRPAPGLATALDAGRLPLRSARGPLARAAGVVLDALGREEAA